MNAVHAVLAPFARHGKLVLVLGLIAGAALPSMALALRPWIGTIIIGLLFLAALRVGPRQAVGALSDIGAALGLTVILQVLMPISAILLFAALGYGAAAFAAFVMLMLSAPPITGSPHLTVMVGGDPAPTLRQMIVGTVLLPLTVIPVFWLAPEMGSPAAILGAAARLMAIIALAGGVGFALRAWLFKSPSEDVLRSIDGLSTIALAVVVVGLMSAVGPAMLGDPLRFAGVLLAVCALNFAIQIVAALLARSAFKSANAISTGIVAGNRNIALFLSVLPDATVDPLLLYIGCYQIPMYITPAVLGRFYARVGARAKG
jgi:ACR3 family arsenite transporter